MLGQLRSIARPSRESIEAHPDSVEVVRNADKLQSVDEELFILENACPSCELLRDIGRIFEFFVVAGDEVGCEWEKFFQGWRRWRVDCCARRINRR
jgi:hypothetical protein